MIKFGGYDRDTGVPALGIGLNAEDCARLLCGEVITVDTAGMPHIPAMDVMVIGGATNEDILKSMAEAGMIADNIAINGNTGTEVN